MDQIAGYHLIKKLGEGGQGITWLAEKDDQKGDPELSRRVVIKELKLSSVDRWKVVERFHREGAVLQQLSHRGIPRYIELIETDHFLGIVTQFIPGETLQSYLEAHTRFGDYLLEYYLEQLIDILSYLEKMGVIHRDINPKNIILAPDEQLYLIDFGAVQYNIIGGGDTVTTMGTFGYMPPEQLIGQTTHQSDLYSAGYTIMVAGAGVPLAKLPKNRETGEIDRKEVLRQLPERIRSVVAGMVEPGLGRRFQTARGAMGHYRKMREKFKDYQYRGTMNYQTVATGNPGYQNSSEPEHTPVAQPAEKPAITFVDSSIKGLYLDHRRAALFQKPQKPKLTIPEGIEFEEKGGDLSIKFERRFVPDDEQYWVTILVGIALGITFLVATGGRQPWLLAIVAVFLAFFWIKKDRIKETGAFEISIEGDMLRSIEAGEVTQHFIVGDLSGVECRNMGAGNYAIYLSLKGQNRTRYFCFLNTLKHGEFVKQVLGSKIRHGRMVPMKHGCGSGCKGC